jgi:hypothetical protein
LTFLLLLPFFAFPGSEEDEGPGADISKRVLQDQQQATKGVSKKSK